MYHEMTSFIVFKCNKEKIYEIFLKSKLQNVFYTLDENFLFNYRIYKTFSYLLSFANFCPTEFVFPFVSFSHNKHFQCFLLQQPKQIKPFRLKSLQKICTHRKCPEPKFRLYLAKLCSRDKHWTTASLIKVSPLKVDVYLMLEIHNTLFTDPA